MYLKAEGKIPGADLGVFHKFIEVTTKLVDQLEDQTFHSLYTVVPLVTQLLGLENPLFGSGKSPFSVISILPLLRDRSSVHWPFDLSLEERRILIDEVYEMIAPILLEERDAYIDLLIDTVHFDQLREDEGAREEFRKITREKFEVLSPLVRKLKVNHPANFAHIAHYGYTEDLQREHGFLRKFPEDRFEEWCERSFPTVFELNFRGLGGDGLSVRGWVIVIDNSTEQLLTNHKLRKAKIRQCAKLAQQLGAHVVGMAGLIAFFGKGGRFLSEDFPGLSFTTGHAYTIANILEIAKRSADKVQLRLQDATVAVVGAVGSIGSGCAKLLTELGVPRLTLVDILWQDHLTELSKTLIDINPEVVISCSNRLQDIRTADLIIVATNSPRTIIEASMLKPGAIIIDDAFPKNVPEKISKERDDLIALEGGIVRLPSGVDVDRGRNVPNVMDVPLTRMVSCHEIYGCFAETLTLAAIHHKGNYGLGLSDPVLAKDIFMKAQKIGFKTAPLQFFGQAINEKRFQRAVQARNQNQGVDR